VLYSRKLKSDAEKLCFVWAHRRVVVVLEVAVWCSG